MRNQILHNGGQANITATTRNIENWFQEFAYAMESEKPLEWKVMQTHPTPPPPSLAGWIKLNVDATIFQEFSTLAVVGRDDNGEFIQVWTKLHELCSPLLAEAAAILWALQIALGEKWD